MNPIANAGNNDVLAWAVANEWGSQYLYCPDCSSPRLDGQETGVFACPKCKSKFQVKARARDSFEDWTDDAMVQAIHRDNAPSYYFMEYDAVSWTVRNLLLVPHFAIPPGAARDNPMPGGVRPRGAGFSLDAVPVGARISIVTTIRPSAKGNTECVILSTPEEVREKFQRFKPFKKLKPAQRGLTLELLKCIHALTEQKKQAKQPPAFTTEELCAMGRNDAKISRRNDAFRRAENRLMFLLDCGLVAPPQRDRWRLK